MVSKKIIRIKDKCLSYPENQRKLWCNQENALNIKSETSGTTQIVTNQVWRRKKLKEIA